MRRHWRGGSRNDFQEAQVQAVASKKCKINCCDSIKAMKTVQGKAAIQVDGHL
jgi:hypothetical protein